MCLKNKYNIVVIGGGISGTLLALECKRKMPEVDILIIEKNVSFGQKVGESVNDIASIYFQKNLSQEILRKHPPKSGLRYLFNNELEGKNEISEFDSPAYKGRNNGFHFDRKIFDEDLLQDVIQRGVHVLRPAEITNIVDQPFNYEIAVLCKEELITVHCERLVDATGRQRYLYKLFKWNDLKLELSTGAVMGYFKNVDWASLDHHRLSNDQSIINSPEFSTIHLMRNHSWWWIIRLNNDWTSIGWVFDKSVHDYSSNIEKYKENLERDPILMKLVRDPSLENVREIDQLPYCSERLYKDGIILIGDSGGFTDPLLSPGMEYIVQQSIWISDLIAKDRKRGFDQKRWNRYQQKFIKSYLDRMDTYKFGYSIMDDPFVMTTWLRAGSFVYFSFYVIPSIAFRTIKKPFQIKSFGALGYRFLKWRLRRIYTKRKHLQVNNRFDYKTSGIKVPYNWTYILLPLKLGFKWLKSQLVLEFSILGRKKRKIIN